LNMRLDPGAATAIRSFSGRNGGTEHFIAVEPLDNGDFACQLESLTRRYTDAVRACGLSPETAIFRRILLSDVLNQEAAVRASRLVADPAAGPVAVSLVQQPPLPAGKIALLAYHIDGDASIAKHRLSPRLLEVRKAGLRHLWITGLRSGRSEHGVSSFDETTTVFQQLVDALAGQGGTLAADCVRTWLYVKDVDVFYQDLVDSRAAFFARHGLTRDTHTIASTGIEGACGGRYEVVAMDAYSVLGLLPEQITYLNDFGLLCSTHDYGVTFERGTRVGYADRAHHFISGTASIDHRGRVVHPGDVLRQLGRTLDNVEGLLHSGSAGLADMMHLIVYLRDSADFRVVRDTLNERCAGLPVLVVQAPVCRPEWLVEVEGIAIAANAQPELPGF
jgi:enamine deaminase RidA (YjgF/YER057c/UK114 family)